jgi:RNA polymerase sigma-70 factor (ECF subfamily)
MKIWLSRDLVTKIDNFDAFLFRIAYHKSIDFLRAAAKDPVLHDLLWERIQLAEDTSADSRLILEEYEKRLREAIKLLSPRKKLIFRMSRMEGLSHDQIAAKLRLSKNTVNNHIVEAKQFIRSYLAGNPDLVILILFLLYFRK